MKPSSSSSSSSFSSSSTSKKISLLVFFVFFFFFVGGTEGEIAGLGGREVRIASNTRTARSTFEAEEKEGESYKSTRTA
jgi:hypothetical protein